MENFVQLHETLNKKTIELHKNSIANTIFYLLTNMMDKNNAICISRDSLAYLLDTSTRNIQKGLTYLKENDFLKVFKVGTSNVYVLNPNFVWKDKTGKRLEALSDYNSNEMYYAEFDAKIIINSKENIEEIKKMISQ